jgi:hypothetical protein
MTSRFKQILIAFFAVLVLAGSPVLVHADNFGLSKTQESTKGLLPKTVLGAKDVPELIGVVVSTVLGFLGIVFFLLVFYSGLMWMTARGDEGKIEDAKKTIEAAVVGLIIVMAAYAITRAVFVGLGAAKDSTSAPSSATPAAPVPPSGG